MLVYVPTLYGMITYFVAQCNVTYCSLYSLYCVFRVICHVLCGHYSAGNCFPSGRLFSQRETVFSAGNYFLNGKLFSQRLDFIHFYVKRHTLNNLPDLPELISDLQPTYKLLITY